MVEFWIPDINGLSDQSQTIFGGIPTLGIATAGYSWLGMVSDAAL